MGVLPVYTMDAIKEIAARYDFNDYPISINKIIKSLDRCKVSSCEMPDYIDAKTVYDPRHDFSLIIMNKCKLDKAYIPRMRFSLAHEIGHIVLGHKKNPDNEYIEDEADEFAGCVLMPEDSFLYYPEKMRPRIFQVSPAAAYKRAENLRLKRFAEDVKRNIKFYCGFTEQVLPDPWQGI